MAAASNRGGPGHDSGCIPQRREVNRQVQDLALLVGDEQSWLSTEGFIDKVSENLQKAMAA